MYQCLTKALGVGSKVQSTVGQTLKPDIALLQVCAHLIKWIEEIVTLVTEEATASSAPTGVGTGGTGDPARGVRLEGGAGQVGPEDGAGRVLITPPSGLSTRGHLSGLLDLSPMRVLPHSIGHPCTREIQTQQGPLMEHNPPFYPLRDPSRLWALPTLARRASTGMMKV